MAVTIQQIAQMAGVSRGTVDRALHGRGRVKEELAGQIRQIAKDAGYQVKHQAGQRGRKEGGARLGIVTQLASSPFMRQVNQGIKDMEKELGYRGIKVLAGESRAVDQEEQLRLIDQLASQGIQGLAIMPVECRQVRARINQLVDQGIQVVTFNSDIAGTGRRCFVGLDNRKSGRAGAGLMGLMTRGKGKVLAITGYFSNSVNSLRVDGFMEECKKSFPAMELAGVHGSFDDPGEVERIIRNAMGDFPDLAGIFVASGGQAGIQRAFEALELRQRPYVVIYDRTVENEKALEEDVVDFLIDQEGYLQGYQPLRILADMAFQGKMPKAEHIYTDINILTKYNL